MKNRIFGLFLITAFMSCQLPTFAALEGVVPDLNKITGGTVTDTINGLDIKATTGKNGVVQSDWNSFNLGSDKEVNHIFTNWSQTFIHNVLDRNPSQIYGTLKQTSSDLTKDYAGTGKVFLINPNGILFGDGANVNLNAFTATTFKPENLQNLGDMTASELSTYTNNLKNYFGPDINIKFSSTDDKIGALIKLDNAKFNIDKTAIIAAKDIEIVNGSEIITNIDYNFSSDLANNPLNYNQSFSNVKLATGGGVEASYKLNGYVYNEDFSVAKGLDGVDYNIVIGSTDVNDGTYIESGNILLKNRGVTYDKTQEIPAGSEGSNILVQNSSLVGNKLINNATGDIDITGNNHVKIKNSLLRTYNTHEELNENANTNNQKGGEINIIGGGNVLIDKSTLQTAFSTQDNAAVGRTQKPGDIQIHSVYGNTDINASNLFSRGNIRVKSALNSNVTNSNMIASNPQANIAKDITIESGNDVNIGNTLVDAAMGNINVKAAKKLNVYKDANGATGNRSIMYAGKDISLIAEDTLIQNTNLSYNNLALYDVDTEAENNVTVKDDSTFEKRNAAEGEGITIDVRGKLTLDKATMKKAVVTEAGTGTWADTAVNHDKLGLVATKDVDVINNSNVTSKSDINITSKNEGFHFFDSKLNATNNIAVNIKNAFIGKNAADRTGISMDSTAEMNAKNVAITTKGDASNIEFTQEPLEAIRHTDSLALNSEKANIKINATNDLTLNNASLTAENGIVRVYGAKAVTMNNGSMKSNANTIITEAGDIKGNINLNNGALLAYAGVGAGKDDAQILATRNFNNDVNLQLTNVANRNAGVNIGGKVVTLDASDGVLSISRIVSNKLNLDANDKFIAAQTTLTADDIAGLDQPAANTNPETLAGGNAEGRAYIEVKDFGGFNLDPTAYSIDENGNYVGFYTASYMPTTYEGQDAHAKHFIDLQGQTGDEKFLLVYTKINGFDDTPPAPILPDPNPNPGVTPDTTSNDIDVIKIPRPTEIHGLPEPITNSITDPTVGMVAAAAAITFDEDNDSEELIRVVE